MQSKSLDALVYIAKGGLDSAFPQFHISSDGGSLFLAHIVVIECLRRTSVHPGSHPSILPPLAFRQQYLPPKPLGGISPIFTGLIGPLSELLKNSTL